MSNKVKYNLKNVHIARLHEKVIDGKMIYTYDKPVAMQGAVSLSLDSEGDSSPFYADGLVYFRSVTNNGYSGDLEVALIPEWFRTQMLQEKLDKNNVLIEKSVNEEIVKFALLFEFDGDEKGIKHVLYNCSASRPSLESETKQESIEPKVEKLSLTADPRVDFLVKARTGDNTDEEIFHDWYKAVYEPKPIEEKIQDVIDGKNGTDKSVEEQIEDILNEAIGKEGDENA